MLELKYLSLLFLAFAAIAAIIILPANYYSKKYNWHYKTTMSLAISISFVAIALVIFVLSRNLKYLEIGLALSIVQGISIYFWLKSKKM